MKRLRWINQLLWTFNTIATVAIVVLSAFFFVFPDETEDLLKQRGPGKKGPWQLSPVAGDVMGLRQQERFAVLHSLPIPVKPEAPRPVSSDGHGPPPPQRTPIASLITLTGLFWSPNPQDAMAVVAKIGTRDTFMLGVNDPIPGAAGARVKSIQSDHILVDNGGVAEKLELKDMSVGAPQPGRSGASGGPPAPGGPMPLAPASPVPAASSDPDGARVNPKMFPTRQHPNNPNYLYVDPRLQQYVLKSLPQLRDEVGIRPAIDHVTGTVNGVQVEKINPNSILFNKGIVAGDIVRKINGRPISSIDQGNDMLNDPQFRNATRADVEIERQGRILTVTYELDR